ncbi:MAG TPA: helix-hairpin-helix domain-containing protein [Arenibacter sp.]|nr:helix-hairpin-helix domain-containing protein [Arenibacter sp.]
MSKRSIKSHFRFNKQERNGIFFLLLIVVSLQLLSYVVRIYPGSPKNPALEVDTELQARIDLLKEEYKESDSTKIYPFNPNYITDYKGYSLGMSPKEIDRLHLYRSDNKFVNSVEEFQEVTQVSDSLLHTLSPYFKFPDWVREQGAKRQNGNETQDYANWPRLQTISRELGNGVKTVVYQDLNSATEADLKAVYGVGGILSKRIIKFRDRLGGFLVAEQLNHVYGLEQEVVDRVLERFRVKEPPGIIKININEASAAEIAELVYIDYGVAHRIVAYREANGALYSFDELTDIEDFPSEKIDIIQLYLQL